MGLQGLPAPEEFGGSGLDPLSCAIALEALGYGCTDHGLVFSLCAHVMSAVVPLWKFGSADSTRFQFGINGQNMVSSACVRAAQSVVGRVDLRHSRQGVAEQNGALYFYLCRPWSRCPWPGQGTKAQAHAKAFDLVVAE